MKNGVRVFRIPLVELVFLGIVVVLVFAARHNILTSNNRSVETLILTADGNYTKVEVGDVIEVVDKTTHWTVPPGTHMVVSQSGELLKLRDTTGRLADYETNEKGFLEQESRSVFVVIKPDAPNYKMVRAKIPDQVPNQGVETANR